MTKGWENPNMLPTSILRLMAKPDRKPLGKAGVTTAEADTKFIAKREREVHNDISNWLRQHNIWFCHSRTDKRTTQQRGVPDYILALPWFDQQFRMLHAEAIAIEVKIPPNKLTPEQEQTRAAMLANGWRYYVVGSLEELRKAVVL